MHVSYEELLNDATAAVRATDTAFGDADAAIEGIIWTECVFGRGHDLHRMAARERPGGNWPAPSVSESKGTVTADLTNCPAYGFTARIAEMVMSAAGRGSDGFGIVEAYGPFGGWILPYIAFRLARDQYHAGLFWRPGSQPQEDEAPATLVLAAAAIQHYVPPILIAPGSAYGARERDKLLVGEVPRRLVEPLRSAAGRRPESSLLAVAATCSAHDGSLGDVISIGNAILSFDLASRAPELLDTTSKLRQAQQAGIEVARSMC
jgi:hypothetical protein